MGAVGLDSMSPARSRRSASHAAGTHGWPQKKNWVAGPPVERGRWIQFAQSPDCGTPTTSRLYPFGASNHVLLGLQTGLLPSTLNPIHFFIQSSSHVRTISVYHF